MADRLRALWDFDDLDPTEQRLRGQLAREADDAARAEVLTRLARIDLERGRLRRSSGEVEAALPLFESAFETSCEAGEYFIAADAAHMAALAAPDRSGFLAWTKRGVGLAEAHDEAGYWLGPLLNTLGWEYYEKGEYEPALTAFERACALVNRIRTIAGPWRSRASPSAKALRALGRSEEAVPLLEQAVAWAETEGAPDGWFHEELAEEYAAVGRTNDAREQARLSLPLLLEADSSFAEDGDRATRLRSIADD